jgi:transcriptional regulator with XRE-family HTH domain
MAVAVKQMQLRTQRPTSASMQARIPTAGQQARLDYERHSQGRELTERELCLVLQCQMQQWQRENVPAAWQIEYVRGWHGALLHDQQRRETARSVQGMCTAFQTFGELLTFLRHRAHLNQQEIADAFEACQCPMDRRMYGGMERGQRSPAFCELASLYKSLVHAGVEIGPQERAAYLLLARQAMEGKRRRRELVETVRWEALEAELAEFDESSVRLLPLALPVGQTEMAVQSQEQPEESFTSIGTPDNGGLRQQQEMYGLVLQIVGELGTMLQRLGETARALTRS